MSQKCMLTRQVCPERQGAGCPCWVEFAEKNIESGESRITKGCVLSLLPKLLMYSEHAANCVAGEISSIRAEAATAVAQIVATASMTAIESGSGERDAV